MRGGLPFAAAGGVTLAAALVFTRVLETRANYDEGVYLASLAALRRGQELGSDVYTSQPPFFYWILQAVTAPFPATVEGARLGFVLVGLLGVVSAIVVGWRLFGTWAGVAAGALLAVAPPYPTVTPTVSADVPAVALGLVSLAVLVLTVRWGVAAVPTAVPALVAGAILAAACLTKLLAVPFVVPFVAIVLAERAGRRVLPWAGVGALLLVGLVALVHRDALVPIWDAAVRDHTDATALGSTTENARWIRDYLVPRTPLAWLVPAGAVAAIASRPARQTWTLWTLVPASWLFILSVRPLADHHFVLLSAAYALGAGPSLALALGGLRQRGLRLALTTAVVLLVAAGLYQEQRRLHRNDVPEALGIVWATDAVRALTGRGETVVSDQPIVLFLADRPTPGGLVDTSNTRIAGGTLTGAEILSAVDRSGARLVVIGRMFRSLPGVFAGLEQRFPQQLECDGIVVRLPKGTEPTGVPDCPRTGVTDGGDG